MKSLARCLFLYIMLNSSAHAIVMGNLADIDEYSEIGSVVTFSSIGSFVAVSEFWVLTAAHVVDTTPARFDRRTSRRRRRRGLFSSSGQ